MNRHVGAIAGRLSLRAPQRRSLEILDRVVELAAPKKGADLASALAAIRAEYPRVTDFERAFPSVCFALATGVGKTRLMGAFVAYLHLAHGVSNFFVLAPNLTIYDKLIADFTPGTPKYVFKGIASFVTDEPEIINGDNYETRGALLDSLRRCKINIFNISKLNSEARGGRQLKMRSFRETLGESYFDYLAAQPDLVLLMDESHHYRASAGARALNELKPVLGLELTATPYVETAKGAAPFKNVIYDYPLARAMADGFVKEPAVVTRRDFDPAAMSAAALQTLKLEDGVRLHEQVKVELATYAAQNDRPVVKPFLLAIAKDTTHAAELKAQVEGLYGGRYADKVIQVDSSNREEETVQRLLNVERAEEPTEIVIHVNMLKEGWDVANLFTIVPLRPAKARTLIEQSIGRGLRLPYGERTGVAAVDRLSIVAHDRFQEIVDDARRADSPIRLQALVLDESELNETLVKVTPRSKLDIAFEGATSDDPTPSAPVFAPEDKPIATLALQSIRRLESRPEFAPTTGALLRADVQRQIVEEVGAIWRAGELALEDDAQARIAAVVRSAAATVIERTIDIPRIVVQPRGEVRSGYRPFTLDLAQVRPPAASGALWVQNLRTGEGETVLAQAGRELGREARLEDYVVRGLLNFDDVSYDQSADLLYDLAGQVVRHLRAYLVDDDEVRGVLEANERPLAELVHAQMQEHWEEIADAGYEAKVTRGWTELKVPAFTAAAGEAERDFRVRPTDVSRMGRYVFTGFRRCLYDRLKFESDPERRLAVVLDRDSLKWLRPPKGQLQIYWRHATEHPEYVPDFIAEANDEMLILECKARNELGSDEVNAKRQAAETWCARSSDYTAQVGGKPWRYVLLAHDAIAENMSLASLVARAER